MDNRRATPRERVLRTGVIVHEPTGRRFRCLLVDASLGGAKLQVFHIGLPDEDLVLLDPGAGKTHAMRVAWRAGPFVGVAFTETRDTEANAADPAVLLGTGFHVLLVDDNAAHRALIAEIVQAWGASFMAVEDGAQGVEAYRAGAFDLVLMDLNMPVMDGYRATEAIRALETERRAPRTPVVVLSANDGDADLEAALKAGADHHLPKPVNVPALLGTMEAFSAAL